MNPLRNNETERLGEVEIIVMQKSPLTLATSGLLFVSQWQS